MDRSGLQELFPASDTHRQPKTSSSHADRSGLQELYISGACYSPGTKTSNSHADRSGHNEPDSRKPTVVATRRRLKPQTAMWTDLDVKKFVSSVCYSPGPQNLQRTDLDTMIPAFANQWLSSRAGGSNRKQPCGQIGTSGTLFPASDTHRKPKTSGPTHSHQGLARVQTTGELSHGSQSPSCWQRL